MNKLSRRLAKLEKVPSFIRNFITNRVLGSAIPFTGTAGLNFEKLHNEEVVISVNNTSRVQNHISQIHAAVSVLIAGTATGIVVGLNLPDEKLPLMKKLSVSYIKRSQGKQTATASLSSDMISKMKEYPKGDIIVPVRVVDETGAEVVVAEMVWAWIMKKTKASLSSK